MQKWEGQGTREVGNGGKRGGGEAGGGQGEVPNFRTAGRRIVWREPELTPKTPRPVASADFLRVYVCNVCMYVGRWQVCRQVGR